MGGLAGTAGGKEDVLRRRVLVVYVLGMGLLIVSVILVGLYRAAHKVLMEALDGAAEQIR